MSKFASLDDWYGEYVTAEMEGHLRANTSFISANVRQAVNAGRADFTPVMLSEFPCRSRMVSCRLTPP